MYVHITMRMHLYVAIPVYVYIYILHAVDGSDYVGISTSVTSLLGTDTINESIVINNDEQNEETEMFSILIYNCTNSLTTCAHGLMNNLEININDDANDCK